MLKENQKNNSQISVFIASNGSLNDPTSGYNRIQESSKALGCINKLNFNFLDKKGIKISDYEMISNKVRDLLLSINPNEILVHDPNDTHQEHTLIYNIVKTASRRLPFNQLDIGLYHQQIVLKANMYVDVKDYINIKKESLKFHKSQQFHEYLSDEYIESFHNNFFPYNRGIKISEAYFEEFKFK